MPGRQFVNGKPYRYGYQGEFAETDEETGKPAFQLRIYDPRINRWLSPDPYGQFASPYMAMGNNWINFVDPDGGTCVDAQGNSIPCPDGYGAFNGIDDIGVFDGGEFQGYGLDEVVIGGNYEFTVLNSNDWINQFTQPRPNVACKRTCDLVAGNSPLNLAEQVALENGNQIQPTNIFNQGINTIDEYLDNDEPITVGVHHKFGTTYNSDKTTDHYVVIMGRGLDNGQIYYRFYEVATRHSNMGIHPQNRLYLNGQEASGRTQYQSRSGVQRHYTLTQVRRRN
jgi:RHS repeat-associated protein